MGGTDGVYYFVARWYDQSLGRFLQADTLIPEPRNIQAWDRYAYSLNNPMKYNDPTGHDPKGPGYCYEPTDPGCKTQIVPPCDNPNDPSCKTGQPPYYPTNTPIPGFTIDSFQTMLTPQPTLGTYYQPGATSTPTATTEPTSTPISQVIILNTADKAYNVSVIFINAYNYAKIGFDAITPNPIAAGIEAYIIQDQKNKIFYLSEEEGSVRIYLMVTEAVVTDVVSTLVGGVAALGAASFSSPTGPGALLAGGAGYVIGAGATYAIFTQGLNSLNDSYFVPFILNKCYGIQ